MIIKSRLCSFTHISVVLIIISATLFFLSSFQKNKFVYADVQSTAKSMVVIDASSNRVLNSKNENQKLPMASTTKIITAITVLENCDNIDQEIKIDDRAVGITGTSIYLKRGECLTIRELLYGMMLPSGNDAATALAYHVGGDIPKFCEMMKKVAISVNAYNSNFTNPHGLDDDNHYTTALDMAKITAKALQNKTFCEIVSTKVTRIKGSSEGGYRYLKNKNRLLNTMQGCIGVKTGYTKKAGRCLVSACDINGFKTVCVVLNCGPMFEESQELINLAYLSYNQYELLPEYSIIRSIAVENGRENEVKVCSKRKFVYPLTEDELNRITYNYVLPNVLNAPIKEDDAVGEVEIYLDNHLLFLEKIYTISSVKKIGVISSIKDILANW